jgi:membrane protease subunit HflC
MTRTRVLILPLLAIFVVIVAVSSVVIVDETEHVVITQFGRPVAVRSEAGLYGKLPIPIQRATRFDRRVLFTGTDETEFLTADKKNVMVSTYLSWRIVDPLTYLATLVTRDFAENRLVALVQSELGSALGDTPFAHIVPSSEDGGGLAELENAVFVACRDVAHRDFGIEITSLGVRRLNFPLQNQQSVFARMRAERARIASGYRSEGEAEAQKIRADADRRRAEILATAESDAARMRGDGEAEAARIYADAYGGHQDFYRFLRTLETYEKVLNENTTLVLPADSPFLEVLMSRVPAALPAGDDADTGTETGLR